MGFLDKLLRRGPKEIKYVRMMDGSLPIYSQYGTDIYAFDVVQQAVGCIVRELKKLNPTHIRMVDNDPVPVDSSIQKVLRNPNPLMTTSDFLEKLSCLLILNDNAFVVPVYRAYVDASGNEQRTYEALYPILPSQVDFLEDGSGKLFVCFRFPNGYETTIPYSNVIHVRINYAVNDFMGGNSMGQPNNSALLETLNINRELLHGIAKAMKASYAVNGIVKYNTMIDGQKMEKNIKEFEERLLKSQAGILPMDLKAEYIPLERKINIVDEKTLAFIDSKILRNYGVSLPILTGDYTTSQYEAFYQHTLEWIIITISQAFTKTLFTPRELSFGNKIELYPKELIFLSMEQTLKMIEILAPTGALYENEKRAALGLRPMEELKGKRYMSLNWVEADKAAQYQLGKGKEK